MGVRALLSPGRAPLGRAAVERRSIRRVWFRLLGSIEVDGPRGTADLSGRHARALVALLVIRWPYEARRTWLEDQIWDGARTSDSALRVLVLRVRRALAEAGLDGVIRTTQNGYVLDLGERDASAAIDLRRFEALLVAGLDARARHDDAAARSLLTEAVELWHGEPFEGASECAALEPERARLTTSRLETIEHLAATMIELGDFDSAAALADPLAGAHPERERLTAVLMLAHLRAGRPAEALRAAERLRSRLADELGVEPGVEVTDLERFVHEPSRGDGVVERVLRHGLAARSTPERASLPARLQYLAGRQLVGRDAELDTAVRAVSAGFGRSADAEADTGAGTGTGVATVVCVSGLPGIGKTRLLAEVAAAVHRDGRDVVYLACAATGGDGHEPVAELVRLLSALDRTSAGSELDELVAEPMIDGSTEIVAEAVVRRARLLDVVHRMIESMSPVLVVIDDVQWIGSASGQFVLELVRSVGQGVVWAFGLRSSSDLVDAPASAALVTGPHVVTLELGQLTTPDIERITGSVLHAGAVGDGVATVVERANGNPLFALELAHYLQRGGDPATAPPDVQRSVRNSLVQLGAEAVRAARLASLARPGYPVGALLRSMVDSDVSAGAVDALQRAGIVEPLTDGRLHFRHPLVAQAVADEIGPTLRQRMHLELATAVADDETAAVVAAEHFLDAGALADGDRVDAAVATALGQLMQSGAFVAAAPFAHRWVASVADRPSRSAARVLADIAAATALLAFGETNAALPLLDAAERLAAELDVPELIADAHTARGPLGARSMTPQAIDDMVALEGRLATGDLTRRIQLLCWAAHHVMVSGDDGRAEALVDAASQLGVGRRGLTLDTLLLGMRYQLAAGASSTPRQAAAAYAEVEELEAESRFVTLSAMTHLFGLTQTLRAGDRTGFRRRLDLLRSQLPHMPRPDLRWWADAADACLAIAAGDPEAVEAIGRAATTASSLQVSHGFPVAALQHVLVRHDAGTLVEMSELLMPRRADTSPTQRMMYALACADAVDLAALRTALASDPLVLRSTGEQWSAVAAMACEAVFVARDERWARSLRSELAPHSGTALTLHGLAYLGAVDVHLARLAAVLGDLDDARARFERGVAFDLRFGAVHLVARARRDAAAVGTPVDR